MPETEAQAAKATDEELAAAVQEAAESAAEGAAEAQEQSDEAFFKDFHEFFDAKGAMGLIKLADGRFAKVESLTIRHLKLFKGQIADATRRLTAEPLPSRTIVTETEDGTQEASRVIDWAQAWPVVLDIVLEDLLGLIQECTSIVDRTGGKPVRITPEQFDEIQIEDLPKLVVPWLEANFAHPTKRRPWVMAVKGLLRRLAGIDLEAFGQSLGSASGTP